MKAILLVSLLVCLTSCSPPKVLVHTLEQPRRSVPAEEVDVLPDSTSIDRPYRVIAHLSVVGAEPAYPSFRGRRKIVDALRDRAGALGADAIVVTLDYGVGGEPVAYTGLEALDRGDDVSGSPGGITRRASGPVPLRVRTIKALAIVYDPVTSN